MSKGRNTTVLSTRLPDGVYEWLKEKALPLSPGDYVRKGLLEQHSVDAIGSVNTDSVDTTECNTLRPLTKTQQRAIESGVVWNTVQREREATEA